MNSKIKKLKDLERKLTVSVPALDYEKKYSDKLSKIKSTTKLDGFRKGNVPNDVLKQRYGESIHYEVLNELIQESYPQEIQELKLKPASSPSISIESEDPAKSISYSAVFEVFPDIKPKISRWKSYEKSEITIDESDIDFAIEDILERYCTWEKVDRPALDKDQVIIDFEGKIKGESFDGNQSKDFKLTIGSNSMIPGFEDNLIGKKSGESFSFKTNFPEDYFKKDLAGQQTEFFITLHEVQKMSKSKIDKELFKKLAMDDVSDEQSFRSEIIKRMEGEIAQQDSLMRMGQTVDNADEDLFPLEDFLENAKKRVKLDLLFSALIQKYELEVKEDDLKVFIDKEAQKYKDPEQFKSWVQSQQQQLDQYKMVILEDMLIEKLDSALKSKTKVIKFSELAKK